MSRLSQKDQERVKSVYNHISEVSEKDARDVDYNVALKKGKQGALACFFGDICILVNLCQDYWSGKYRNISFKTISLIAGTLIYVVSPLDVIPDIIPLLGLTDDAALLYMTLESIKSEIAAYKKWKNIE